MKNKKWWQKFKNGNTRLVILAIVSFSAGISMMVAPEKTSHWIIRGVGLVWTLEAISYCLDLRLNYLKKQKEALTIHSVVDSFTCGERDEKGFADLYVNGKKTNTRLLLWDKEEVERLQKIAEKIHSENRSK